MVQQSQSVNVPLMIQTLGELRGRLHGLIARMNARTAIGEGPALLLETEQWVKDLVPTSLMLELVEGFTTPKVRWDDDKVSYLNEWNTFLSKAGMALIEELRSGGVLSTAQ